MLDRMAELASNRGGYKTWEYYFEFGGGAPPWTSGLSQGTAIQAFARGYELLGDESYKKIGHDALGAFEKAPPVGVRVSSNGGNALPDLLDEPGPAGAERVPPGDDRPVRLRSADRRQQGAQALFQRGDRAARREIPRFDTGAWSLYSLGGRESDLGYHRLVRDFLDNLCDRTKTAVYCKTATKFTNYQRQKPVVKLRTAEAAQGQAAGDAALLAVEDLVHEGHGRAQPAAAAAAGAGARPDAAAGAAGPGRPRVRRRHARGRRRRRCSPARSWSAAAATRCSGRPRKQGKYAVIVEAIDLNNHKVQVEVRLRGQVTPSAGACSCRTAPSRRTGSS